MASVHVAKAQDRISIAAIACSVSGVDQGLVAKTHGKVYFQDGKTGGIVLFCQVPESLHQQNVNRMFLTMRDSTGEHDESGRVSADLRRVARNTGAISSVPFANINSEGPGGCQMFGGSQFKVCNKIFAFQQLNFDSFFYFVQINMDRSAPSQEVEVVGLVIDSTL